MRGVIIAGTHSGCGKTTVTLGIMAALRKKGLAVQPFKTGPDFIDAGLHRLVLGRPSRNLDQWMCGRNYVLDCFTRYASNADVAVIEGVMGMYDGDFSTADLARVLKVPVVLIVDAYGMAESAGAVVKGFAEFGVRNSLTRSLSQGGEGLADEDNSIAGVIFNRVASENHYKRLKDSVRGVPVLGYLPRELNFEIPHRHLGLTVAEEGPLTRENIERLADTVLKHVDVDAITRAANPAKRKDQNREGVPCSCQNAGTSPVAKETGIRIALAYDNAFCFYYEDNLGLLREAGAEIVWFSPLSDPAIPDTVDAVYIGGGYPELHADALSRNTSMLASLRAWADAGKPMYAECGGLMYLSRGIQDFDNTFFPMTGIFPFETRMLKKPKLAYREIVLNEDCILGNKGERCRGHEFHYSEIAGGEMRSAESCTHVYERDRECRMCGARSEIVKVAGIYSVRDKNGVDVQIEGFRSRKTLASYIHVHFGSSPHIARRFTGFVKGSK